MPPRPSAPWSGCAPSAAADELVLTIHGKPGPRVAFDAGRREPIVVSGLAEHLLPGKNRISLELSGGNRFPFTLALRCRLEKPASSDACRLHLETDFERSSVEEGKTLPLRVCVSNVSDKPLSMPIAVIGLPAGLEIVPAVLDDLKKSGTIAQWEITGRELALYWYGIEPRARRELFVDLLARVPGKTTGPASRAWLYYDGEARHWREPLTVTVRPAR